MDISQVQIVESAIPIVVYMSNVVAESGLDSSIGRNAMKRILQALRQIKHALHRMYGWRDSYLARFGEKLSPGMQNMTRVLQTNLPQLAVAPTSEQIQMLRMFSRQVVAIDGLRTRFVPRFLDPEILEAAMNYL
jgi:hypothetical protein